MFDRGRAYRLLDGISSGSTPPRVGIVWEYLVVTADRYGVITTAPGEVAARIRQRGARRHPTAEQVEVVTRWLRENFLITRIDTAKSDPYANCTYRIILDGKPSPKDPRQKPARPRRSRPAPRGKREKPSAVAAEILADKDKWQRNAAQQADRDAAYRRALGLTANTELPPSLGVTGGSRGGSGGRVGRRNPGQAFR